MRISGGLGHHRYWLWVFVLLSILAIWVLLYLQNPRFLYPLTVAIFVAIVFLALLGLRPKYRQALVRRLLGLNKRDLETGGLFHRYGRLAGILIAVNSLIFSLLLQYQLVSSKQTYAVFAFIYVQMFLGMVLLVSLLRLARKRWWKYPIVVLIILTLVVVAILTAMLLLELALH